MVPGSGAGVIALVSTPAVTDPWGSVCPMHCTKSESLVQVISSWTASRLPVWGIAPSELSSKVPNGSPPGTVDEEMSIANLRTVPSPTLLVQVGAGGAITFPTIDAPSLSHKVKLAGVDRVPNTKFPDWPPRPVLYEIGLLN